MSIRSLTVFALFILLSCSNKNKLPSDILPQGKMQAVLWSMITAGEFLNAYVLKDSLDTTVQRSRIYGQVFQIHNITKDQFEKSYSYYRQHPAMMRVMLDSLSKKQNYDIEQMRKRQDSARNRPRKPIIKDSAVQ